MDATITHHVGFEGFINTYLRSPAIVSEYAGKQARHREVCKTSAALAREIEKLAPAVDRGVPGKRRISLGARRHGLGSVQVRFLWAVAARSRRRTPLRASTCSRSLDAASSTAAAPAGSAASAEALWNPLKALVARLKSTQYAASGKSYFDYTTIVLASLGDLQGEPEGAQHRRTARLRQEVKALRSDRRDRRRPCHRRWPARSGTPPSASPSVP